MSDPQITETTDEGRQGETSGHMRWVLLASIVLSVVSVAAVWLYVF